MLNKKLVLGSLVAGAFLLPLTANAGVVSGPCVNCHTMHAMQDGASLGGPNAQLLLGTGCITCHAHASDNDATGIAATGIPAPQVNSGGANPLAGGYFDAAGTDAQQHNVQGIVPLADVTLVTTPPGGIDLGAQIVCGDCHGGSGGHHGTGNAASARTGTASDDTYRMLYSAAVGVAVSAGQADYGVNDGSVSGYLTSGANNMNAFCATCHGLFHGTPNQGSQATAWVRHPTDWSLTEADVASATTYAANWGALTATQKIILPLASNGVQTDDIMCITCHRPHGSAEDDLLRFTYANNQAGDATADFGCESCHGVK
jgi:predicted CXXCH cytochrome family protein